MVEYREFIGMLGANGSGKTTLMRAALGLIPAGNWTVRAAGARPSAAGDLEFAGAQQLAGPHLDRVSAQPPRLRQAQEAVR